MQKELTVLKKEMSQLQNVVRSLQVSMLNYTVFLACYKWTRKQLICLIFCLQGKTLSQTTIKKLEVSCSNKKLL